MALLVRHSHARCLHGQALCGQTQRFASTPGPPLQPRFYQATVELKQIFYQFCGMCAVAAPWHEGILPCSTRVKSIISNRYTPLTVRVLAVHLHLLDLHGHARICTSGGYAFVSKGACTVRWHQDASQTFAIPVSASASAPEGQTRHRYRHHQPTHTGRPLHPDGDCECPRWFELWTREEASHVEHYNNNCVDIHRRSPHTRVEISTAEQGV